MARTLVTGASGFVARQRILDLLEHGHRVRGSVRSAAKPIQPNRSSMED
jgi:nucleoside-diphosphate-sugar epimerase